MDVFRAALIISFVVLIWNFQLWGIRPIRDFFMWGIFYPVHFVLAGVLILVIWGVVGSDFGLQGLFLDEDPLTQVLLGSTVMMLFAAIIVHYSVVGDSANGWRNSLRSVIGFLRIVNSFTDSNFPVQGFLKNGFLNLLTKDDIKNINQYMKSNVIIEDSKNKSCFLDDDLFRLLVSPAIILVKGFMLIFLVGAVPSVVIPLLNNDPVGCLERLPWLVGVCLGDIVGVILACWTTQWATNSPKWDCRRKQILESIGGLGSASNSLSGNFLGEKAEKIMEKGNRVPGWVRFLFVFFVVHFIVNNLISDDLSSSWIDWSEHSYSEFSENDNYIPALIIFKSFPVLPFFVIFLEVGFSVFLLFSYNVILQTFFKKLSSSVQEFGKKWIEGGIRIASRPSFSKVFLILPTILVIGCLGIALVISPETTNSLLPGFRGYASLGSMLSLWLGGFWLATHSNRGDENHRRFEQVSGGLGALLFVLLDFFQASNLILAPLAIIAVATCGARIIQSLRVSSFPDLSLAVLVFFGVCGTGFISFALGWILGDFTIVTKVWTGISILFLGSRAIAKVASTQPSLLYPLTVFLSFLAFAIPYNALGEEWQSSMPAAGSIACFIALLAAIYSVIVFVRPKSAFFLALGLIGLAILLNGVVLFVSPNHFKSTFPNMSEYYALPVYLDSRDYFRSTTPSTVRLHNRVVLSDFDRLDKQGDSQRLATAFFKKPKFEIRKDGVYVVSISVEDGRGRLRAIVGDKVRLTGEEWFTIKVDGEDCIALAEEPFFRKIFPLFQYESLHFIREGIIRGPKYFLSKGSFPFLRSGKDVKATRYDIISQPEHLVGLRLRGLASDYNLAEAQYVLVSMNWTGRVTEVGHSTHLDSYTVQFELPSFGEPLNDSQLGIMGAWMERCHLDTIRELHAVLPKLTASIPGVKFDDSPKRAIGDCLSLDDARSESPVPVGTFLVGDPLHRNDFPEFADYWLTNQNLDKTISTTPYPKKNAPENTGGQPGFKFTLRPAHERGLFASPIPFSEISDFPTIGGNLAGSPESKKTTKVAMYNSGRLRPGDRLILSWKQPAIKPHESSIPGAMIFEVQEVGSTTPSAEDSRVLPQGFQWVALLPITDSVPKITDSVSNQVVAAKKEWKRGKPFQIGEWQVIQPLNNTEVLLAWKQVVGGRWKEKKPKMVIVTVSGGGIRSSVWTSIVLRKLETTLGSDFPYHIRLITGASGGMVGGSYYATSLVPPPERVLKGENVDFYTLHNAPKNEFIERVATGQLDALLGRMIFADIPGILNPFLRKGDRGRTLEQTWVRWTGGASKSPLARPLQSYAADEKTGWRPSMVYTPMMVEDGRRLLISNLDLAFATRNIGGLLIEPSSRKIERSTIQGGDFDLSIHEEDDVFSLSAVEFFRLFPEAHDFRVSTAARMSASFPWVSPAVNLPTLPPRRVVDAAYYDNYGVNLSALWLAKMSAWLQENTSGVVVIQIRDNVSQGARTEIDFDRLGGKNSVLERLTWNAGAKLIIPGLQAITTPLIGISSARQWTMAFRNDEQVDLLDLIFDEQDRNFFRTVVFECPVDVSLSWKLTDHEKEILLSGFGRPDTTPREELSRIKDFLIGKDSYEFQKWQIEHRNDADFQHQLKEQYDEQLRSLGFKGTDRITLRQSQVLYENVMKNLKRLELLGDWWRLDRM